MDAETNKTTPVLGRTLQIWLWVSVALAIIGAMMLYPIGTPAKNILFILIKVGMVTGLLVMLLAKRKAGFPVWAIFSVCAVVMTIFKCMFTGSVTFLFIGSMFVDIFMPAMAYAFIRNDPSQLV